MSAAPLTVVVRMRSRPGKRDELIGQCGIITGIGRGEEGTLGFSYSFAGDHLLAIEMYADAAAFLRHLELAATIAAHSEEIAEIEDVVMIGTPEVLEELADVVTQFGASTSTIVTGFHK
jgi:quinol monooxygenase YgiN